MSSKYPVCQILTERADLQKLYPLSHSLLLTSLQNYGLEVQAWLRVNNRADTRLRHLHGSVSLSQVVSLSLAYASSISSPLEAALGMATSDHRRVEIKVIEGRDLAKLGKFAFDDKFQVKLSFGDQPLVTTKLRKRRQFIVPWNQAFAFIFTGQMPMFTLEVYGQSSVISSIQFIGRTSVSFADFGLSETQETDSGIYYTCSLRNDSGKDVGKVDISTQITSFGVPELEAGVGGPLARLRGPDLPGLTQRTGVDSDALAPARDLVTSLLDRMNWFADILAVVSEAHPYAKAAWSILDCVRSLVMAQIEQDENLRSLAKQMNSLYERVSRVVDEVSDGPPTIQERYHGISLRVARQANECAYFIRDYCKDKDFRTRVIKRIVSSKESKLEEYQSAFANLTKELDENVRDGTQEVVTFVWQDVRDLNEKIDEAKATALVDKLKTVDGASLVVSGTSPKQCLPGTRVDLLNDITDWINQVREGSQDQRLLLLHGMAGTGKSSIAHTIASRFDHLGRLGASFAFSRRSPNSRRLSQLFPHIARSLVDLDPTLKHHLAEILEKGSKILDSPDPTLHFETFIVGLLRKVTITGPIVIVLDAIDEAPEEENNLPSLLTSCCADLPSNIRILITSRPEAYILDEMRSPAILCLSMPNASGLNGKSDITRFIEHQLLPPKRLDDIDEACCAELARTSQGLFQWAAIACNEIKPPRYRRGVTARQRYETVVALGARITDKNGLLDEMYQEVLKQIYDLEKNPGGHELLKTVIAVVLALMEPQTLEGLAQLYNQLGFGEESDVHTTLPDLASILDGISDATRPIQPNHTSLRDFFLEPNRSGSFCVASLMPGTHNRAARSSFKIVSTSLPQSAIGLDFAPLVRNEDFDDDDLVSEADRVQGEMPQHVEYAALYGVKHLAEAPAPEEAFWTDLKTSLLADDHALLWIQVFCLLVIHKLRSADRYTPPELSGCMRHLAHIAKQPGSACPPRVQSAAELASTIFNADSDPPFQFSLGFALVRLGEIYASSAWTVKLQHQPGGYGPLVTTGTGFFLYIPGASHDVVLTTAHNLLDANGHLHTALVVDIPHQVTRLNGISQFSDVQFSVPSTDVHVCADFSQRQQLETDWAAIRLPRGTALWNGFKFDLTLKGPDTVALGIYGQLSWIDRHLYSLVADSSDSVADVAQNAMTAHGPATRLADPVASGAPIYVFGDGDYLIARGILNPTYGDNRYTKLTPALIRELGSWLGFAGKSDTRLRWRPPILPPPPSWENLYLYVNENVNEGEGLRLYLKHESGSSFNVSSPGTDSFSDSASLGFGSKLVAALHEETEDIDRNCRLACVSASDHEAGLIVQMEQHMDTDQQTWREMVTLLHESYYFYVESTPNADSSHGDPGLIKISLRDWRSKAKQGSTEFGQLNFALE